MIGAYCIHCQSYTEAEFDETGKSLSPCPHCKSDALIVARRAVPLGHVETAHSVLVVTSGKMEEPNGS